jgi:hypothetical protein
VVERQIKEKKTTTATTAKMAQRLPEIARRGTATLTYSQVGQVSPKAARQQQQLLQRRRPLSGAVIISMRKTEEGEAASSATAMDTDAEPLHQTLEKGKKLSRAPFRLKRRSHATMIPIAPIASTKSYGEGVCQHPAGSAALILARPRLPDDSA